MTKQEMWFGFCINVFVTIGTPLIMWRIGMVYEALIFAGATVLTAVYGYRIARLAERNFK